MIVNNDEEGAGHTEKAGADEDDHRHQQHEHEVGVGRLQIRTSVQRQGRFYLLAEHISIF